MQMIFFVSLSAAAAITEIFSEKGKKEKRKQFLLRKITPQTAQ